MIKVLFKFLSNAVQSWLWWIVSQITADLTIECLTFNYKVFNTTIWGIEEEPGQCGGSSGGEDWAGGPDEKKETSQSV